MTTKITATLTEQGLSLIINGSPKTISRSHTNFEVILKALRDKDYDAIPDLIDVAQAIETKTNGLVEITNGQVFYNGEVMSGTIVTRMLEMVDLGLDITPLSRFLARLMRNPSNRSVTQLYDFMEACDLPITEDGRLLCYRSVKDNYYDSHTGRTTLSLPPEAIESHRGLFGSDGSMTVNGVTTDISTGKCFVSMHRNKVNDNPDQTCSHGLHVCSQAYGNFSQRLMLVAVCPSDVVSVPRDYNSAKMRVAKYEVLKDVKKEGFRTFEKEPVYQDDTIDWDFDEDDFEDDDFFTL